MNDQLFHLWVGTGIHLVRHLSLYPSTTLQSTHITTIKKRPLGRFLYLQIY
jgi:hypothetical protein